MIPKTYKIHGNQSDYAKGESVTCLDSEGNIFPSFTACAKYHGISVSTLNGAAYFRPVKSKLLDKKICAIAIYQHPDLIFNPDQTQLAAELSMYETLFTDYIFKKIPAICKQDGTYVKAKKNSFGVWYFEDTIF